MCKPGSHYSAKNWWGMQARLQGATIQLRGGGSVKARWHSPTIKLGRGWAWKPGGRVPLFSREVAGCVSQVGQARKGGRNCANGTSGDTFYARGTKQDNRGLDLLLELEIPAGGNPQNRGGWGFTRKHPPMLQFQGGQTYRLKKPWKI
jgi:hypothetical protein